MLEAMDPKLSQRLTSVNFSDPDLLDRLDTMSLPELDALPFGAVGLDADMNVAVYNAREASLAGLSPSRVLGRHMFEEVAICMNNFLVAQRFEDEVELDAEVPFILTLRMRPTPVTLRLLRRPGTRLSWILIDRSAAGH